VVKFPSTWISSRRPVKKNLKDSPEGEGWRPIARTIHEKENRRWSSPWRSNHIVNLVRDDWKFSSAALRVFAFSALKRPPGKIRISASGAWKCESSLADRSKPVNGYQKSCSRSDVARYFRRIPAVRCNHLNSLKLQNRCGRYQEIAEPVLFEFIMQSPSTCSKWLIWCATLLLPLQGAHAFCPQGNVSALVANSYAASALCCGGECYQRRSSYGGVQQLECGHVAVVAIPAAPSKRLPKCWCRLAGGPQAPPSSRMRHLNSEHAPAALDFTHQAFSAPQREVSRRSTAPTDSATELCSRLCRFLI